MSLGTSIKTIQDIMRKDAGVVGDAQRIGQLAWMLFLKVLDDLETAKEETSKSYHSPIPAALRWHVWTADTMDGSTDELLGFVNDKLFPGLRALTGADPLSGVVRGAFEDAQNYMRSGKLLQLAITSLSKVDWTHSADQSEIGGLYEQLLSALPSASDAGKYYTPRALTAFMVELLDPQMGETILDPACGSGGGLAATIEHLREKHPKTDSNEHIIRTSIQGIEKEPLPHLLCMTRMMLHGIDVPTQIRRANALAWAIDGYQKKDLVDVIISTPPFRGADEGLVEGSFPSPYRLRETADTFLNLIITLLRPGGRAAVVILDGLLFGKDPNGVKTELKERLLTTCDLHTIVRLPKGVFSSYAAATTDLLFFTKGRPTTDIWCYEHPCPEGRKSYSKTKPLRLDDFEPERTWWKTRQQTAHAWKVSADEIKRRGYSLTTRNSVTNLGRAPSRVGWLSLNQFRGFANLVLELPKEGPVVLIGTNGAGKSSVLAAIATHLSLFTALASEIPTRQIDAKLVEADIKMGNESAGVRAMFRVGEEDQVWELLVTREHGAGPADKGIARQAEALLAGLARSDQTNIPVLCYYPATRGFSDGGVSNKRQGHRSSQIEAYDRAFGSNLGPFQDFAQWFRAEEDFENEGRLRVDPGYLNPRLETVRRAIGLFVNALGAGRFSNPRMERFSAGDGVRGAVKPAELVLDKDGVRLSLEQLSEGERNTLLLVADLARRLATANPWLEDRLQGEGIVLIDEIDLHLHPAWQRGVLPALSATFPRCQIIASTHSPQVLSRIPKENVFILEDFRLVQVTPHTYGRDSNSILGEVFGVPERPADIENKIHEVAVLLHEERVAEAKAALDELRTILGENDTELLRLRTVLSFVETPVAD